MQRFKTAFTAGFAASLLCLPFVSSAAWARDGFGNEGVAPSYFSGTGSAALGDGEAAAEKMNAMKMNAMAPAAGPGDEAQPGTGKPAGPDEKAAADLEKTYGTSVDRKTIDRGQGGAQTQDTYGQGDVHVFQSRTTKGQVMDDDSAAGVRVDVMKFK